MLQEGFHPADVDRISSKVLERRRSAHVRFDTVDIVDPQQLKDLSVALGSGTHSSKD